MILSKFPLLRPSLPRRLSLLPSSTTSLPLLHPGNPRLKQWRDTEISKIPLRSPFPSLPISHEPLHEKFLRCIHDHSMKQPTRKAFASVMADNPSKSISYGELHLQTRCVQSFLISRGFSKGDVASLVLRNCIEWAVINMGAWAAGGAVSGASALFTPYELERQFVDSQSRVVFTDDAHLEDVLVAAKASPLIHTIVCIRPEGASSPLPSGVVPFSSVLSTPPSHSPVPVDGESLAALPNSSGTTGSPKGVMLSHRNFGTMVEIFTNHFLTEVLPLLGDAHRRSDVRGGGGRGEEGHPQDSFILALPFYHIFGFGLLSFNLLAGWTGVVQSKFDPLIFLTAVEKYKPRILFLVPPILIFMAKHPMVKSFDVSSVEVVIVGAAATGKETAEEFLRKHPNVKYLGQGYGATECGFCSHLPVFEDNVAYKCSGTLIANGEQKTVDPLTGKDLGVGERGEICLRSPTNMMGYLNRPEETAITLDKDGWLHTGDIGYYDEMGRTYIVDRLKELIKVKGLQVPPAELEDLLLSHPLITDCAVIGIPDYNKGELVRAYVVRSNDSLTEEEVSSFVAGKVSVYKHLTGGVRFVQQIPKAPSGKILRRVLKEEAAKEKTTH